MKNKYEALWKQNWEASLDWGANEGLSEEVTYLNWDLKDE